jgi:capsular polysaccharide biosynthesis protein
MSAHDSISSRATSLETPDTLEATPRVPSAEANRAAGGRAVTPDRGPVTLATAVRRHPILTVVPAIVLLAVGIVAGAKKPPTYSATATINVGKSDINTQATPGYVQASTVLASTYSRLVMSQHISVPTARAVHESATAVGANLSSVPIPTQPTFTITATGNSPQAAVNLTNAAVSALQGFVNHSATQQGGTTQLLAKYKIASTHAAQLQQTTRTLQRRLAAQQAGLTQTAPPQTPVNQTPVTQAQVIQAQVGAAAASLQAEALGNQYLSLAQNGTAPTLDVLINPTATTASNRTSNIEKYGVIGAVGGLIIGIALAALVSRVEARPQTTRA